MCVYTNQTQMASCVQYCDMYCQACVMFIIIFVLWIWAMLCSRCCFTEYNRFDIGEESEDEELLIIGKTVDVQTQPPKYQNI